ncbi:MAG: IS110 family transposase [Chloroflexi bacterium]|nr:IS110 family transposase [Chloroflexota bacterium]
MNTLYTGIDISQADFTCSIWINKEAVDLGEFINTQTGFEALAATIAPYQAIHQCKTIHIILEATGGYELYLLSFICAQGWSFSLPNPKVDSVERIIAFLEAQELHINDDITELVKENPALRAQSKQLLTVSGVGKKTVLPILVLCHRYQARTCGQGTSKGITAYLGLDAQESSSGSSVWKRPTISKMGNSRMRARFYLASLGGIRAKIPSRSHALRLPTRSVKELRSTQSVEREKGTVIGNAWKHQIEMVFCLLAL